MQHICAPFHRPLSRTCILISVIFSHFAEFSHPFFFSSHVPSAAVSISPQVQARLKLMEKMVELDAPDDERKFAFKFPEPAPLRKETLIQVIALTSPKHHKQP